MKNPLVIIGMIAVVFEGIAVVSFTIGIDRLSGNLERQPIIWFIVGFPIFVLSIIALLVARRNLGLDVPSGYNSDRNYLKASQKRIDSERLYEAKQLGLLTANEETRFSINVIKKIFSQSEAAGLADASNYFGVSLRKNVAINKNILSRIVFDGMAYKDDTLCVVKVKLIQERNWKEVISLYLQRMSADVARLEKAGIKVDALLELVPRESLSSQTRIDIDTYFYRESRNFGFRFLKR